MPPVSITHSSRLTKAVNVSLNNGEIAGMALPFECLSSGEKEFILTNGTVDLTDVEQNAGPLHSGVDYMDASCAMNRSVQLQALIIGQQ